MKQDAPLSLHAGSTKVSACAELEFQLCFTNNAARRVGRQLKAIKFVAKNLRALLLGV